VSSSALKDVKERLRVTTQAPLQSIQPGGQTQVPPEQILQPVQTPPHQPHAFGSFIESLQTRPQQVQPAGQAAPQAPQLVSSS